MVPPILVADLLDPETNKRLKKSNKGVNKSAGTIPSPRSVKRVDCDIYCPRNNKEPFLNMFKSTSSPMIIKLKSFNDGNCVTKLKARSVIELFYHNFNQHLYTCVLPTDPVRPDILHFGVRLSSLTTSPFT